LWLYREPHQGFNVAHFTDPLRGRMLYVDDSQPRYIGDVFLPWHRRHWTEMPTQPGDAFVRAAYLGLDAIFRIQHEHTMAARVAADCAAEHAVEFLS